MLRFSLLFTAALLIGCQPLASTAAKTKATALPFDVTPVAEFNEPWAMTFLPDGKSYLVTEKSGKLFHVFLKGLRSEVMGLPKVSYGGQGGLGDVILAPDFEKSRMIYLSWAEAGDKGTHGAVVAKAVMHDIGSGLYIPTLKNLEIIWRQYPKVTGRGHYGHRLAFGPDKFLYIASGERQKMDPAQNRRENLGKIVRIDTKNGMAAPKNPFYDDALARELSVQVLRDGQGANAQAQIWSMGHRNPLGLAFDAEGRLWDSEMGPAGGDELNLVKPGANYGWPQASNGTHYDGRDIPDHNAKDGFEPPKINWTPSISPSSLMIYSGNLFPKWKGDAFIGALSGEALIRVDLDGETARKADQWQMNARIREVEQSPDGTIWLLEDGSKGRLLKLTPKG